MIGLRKSLKQRLRQTTPRPQPSIMTGAVPRMAQQSARDSAREGLTLRDAEKLKGGKKGTSSDFKSSPKCRRGQKSSNRAHSRSLLETGNVTLKKMLQPLRNTKRTSHIIEPQVEVKLSMLTMTQRLMSSRLEARDSNTLARCLTIRVGLKRLLRDRRTGRKNIPQPTLASVSHSSQRRQGSVDDAAVKFADVLQFDAMPAAVQQAVLDDADAVVSDDDTVDLATMVQAAQKAGLSQDLIDRTKAIAERQQTRTLDSEQRFTKG